MVHWPPVYEDRGTEAVTDSFGQPVNTAEIAFWETPAVRQLSFIPERGEIIKDGDRDWGIT